MAKEKNLNINQFKSLVKKLIKEEIQRTTKSNTLKESKSAISVDETPAKSADGDSSVKDKIDALEAKIEKGYSKLIQFTGAKKEAKQKELEDWRKEVDSLKESVLVSKKKLVVLEHRRMTINKILKEASWFDKLRGTVDPSAEVDDPKHIRKNIEGALSRASKFASDFNEKSLATSTAINAYHEVVTDALDKLSLLSGEQTWMPGMKQEFEGKIVDAAKTFYKLMNNEKGRIEAFTKTLMNDLQSKGFDKSYLTVDKKTKAPEFQVSTPKDVSDASLVDKAIAGAKGMVDTK